MGTEWHIRDEWASVLAAAGMETFDAMIRIPAGECLSRHTRGHLCRIVLAGGQTVFLKRDEYTGVKDVFTDLWHLRLPRAPCANEAWALRRVAQLGIPAPKVIAWGQHRRGPIPTRGGLVMSELPGVSMREFLNAEASEDRRRAVMRSAGRVAGRLYGARLSWPDIAPKHFIVNADSIGILDLARMRPTRLPRRCYVPKQLRRFCGKLRDCPGSESDVTEFLDAIEFSTG